MTLQFRSLLVAALCVPFFRLGAVEPDFTPLLDRDHASGWKQCGLGGMKIKDGVGTTWFPNERGSFGVAWYGQRPYQDFILRVEYRATQDEYNSGLRLRFPDPGNESGRVSQEGYEISILSPGGRIHRGEANMLTGSIAKIKAPITDPRVRPIGAWNEMEVVVVGQKYTVRHNGQLVNEFIGDRHLNGYVGIENHKVGSVEFRNMRIRELPGGQPSSSEAPPLVTIPTDPRQPLVETLSQQAPNASAWVLAPLDQSVPPDIRQNLTFLLEDLLDEGKLTPKASPTAYKLGEQLCRTMIAALDERKQALAAAGFRAVEANARTGVTSQALEARRNYQMRWPQYAREQAQRAELKSQAFNNAEVMKERPKLEWAQRNVVMQRQLDTLYSQFRDALRQSATAR